MIIIIEGVKFYLFRSSAIRRKNGKSVSKWCVCVRAALAAEWHNAAAPLCFSHHEFAFGLFRDHYIRVEFYVEWAKHGNLFVSPVKSPHTSRFARIVVKLESSFDMLRFDSPD
jgi:hypothetical protein